MAKISFPSDFDWAVASASYQIEGGWNADDKGESIWDRFAHTPGKIVDGTTGDVSIDFYHKYEEDIRLMAKMGYPALALSISWPRVMPDGVTPSAAGIDFYRRVFNCCHENGVKVYATLYHWDLPQALQDKGGWCNREIVKWFEDYAKLMYKEYGDLVDSWVTMNEVCNISMAGYASGGFAPGIADMSAGLLAQHNVMLSHGAAVRAYRESGLKAEIGYKTACCYARPCDPNREEDIKATILLHQQNNTIHTDPLFKGEYPKELYDRLAAKGCVMPRILPGDMELITTPIDYIGMNNYMPIYAIGADNLLGFTNSMTSIYSGNPLNSYGWEIDPDAYYRIIKWLDSEYHLKKIILSENGYAGAETVNPDGSVDDPRRIDYLKKYLAAARKAMDEGVPIKGYYIWSLWDNFEWAMGYTQRFGIWRVDMNTLKRTPKASAYWYSDVIKNNGFEL